jgi:hypothetical protein
VFQHREKKKKKKKNDEGLLTMVFQQWETGETIAGGIVSSMMEGEKMKGC